MDLLFWRWVRRGVMIVVPLLLVLLEWNHPSGFSGHVYETLNPIASWWKWLHICQSFLFGAAAFGALFLTWNIHNGWSSLAKVFLWVFLVCYLVFDSTGGIAVGFVLETAQQHPNFDTETIQNLVQLQYNDPIIGGSNSFYSLTGSYAWLFGIALSMIAVYQTNRHLALWKIAPPLLLLGVSSYTLYVGHYAPYGPIAFGCFAAASLWFEAFHFGPAGKNLP